jgi:hypothetical protein
MIAMKEDSRKLGIIILIILIVNILSVIITPFNFPIPYIFILSIPVLAVSSFVIFLYSMRNEDPGFDSALWPYPRYPLPKYSLRANVKFCRKCNMAIPPDSNICQNCGEKY